MTAVAPRARTLPGRRQVFAQTAILARRSALATLRQPAAIFSALFFPLMIAAVNTSTLGRATSLPGFPEVDSMLDYFLVGSCTQGILFAGVQAGGDLATDIETGFFDRLLASPVSRTAILIGRLAGAVTSAVTQSIIFLVIFSAFGVRLAGGLFALVVLLVYAALLSIFIGGLTSSIALKTGQAEAVQNLFPLTFIFMFISSAFFPTGLMSGVYQTLAQANPITTMIDGVRYQQIVGADIGEAAVGLGYAAAAAIVSIGIANLALRRRLASL